MANKELIEKIENVNVRSAWEKGVKEYALELLENLESEEITEKRF